MADVGERRKYRALRFRNGVGAVRRFDGRGPVHGRNRKRLKTHPGRPRLRNGGNYKVRDDVNITHHSEIHNDFSVLLERAGFHIRGKRADCSRCEADGPGKGRGTIAFTDEVAYCHRCQWTRNIRTLSRELGVNVSPETQQERERRELHAEFKEFLDTTWLVFIRRLWCIQRKRTLAVGVLACFPECEPAWAALADCHDELPWLLAALDTLAFEKTSCWLETPMSRDRLFAAFCEAEGRDAIA